MIISNALLIIMNMYVASWGKLLIWVKLVNLAKLLGEALENLNSRISIQIFFNKKGERIGGLRINSSYAYGAVT